MTSARDLPKIDQLVCSGGGTRCFWQGGFLDSVRDAIGLEPERISSVSGGALTAAGFIARKGPQVLERMKAAFAECDSNMELNTRDDEDGLTIHQRLYRDVVSDVFDREAQKIVADGPVYQVLIGHPPDDDMGALSGSAAALAYEAELHAVGSPHFDWAEDLGVTTTLVDARQAARDGKLVDLICAAATIPPLFELARWNGRPVIDGGMADQAPQPDPDEGTTLVLLTRDYDQLPEIEGRYHVAPSDEVPADKVDFTDPDKIARTWDQGARDGERFLNPDKED